MPAPSRELRHLILITADTWRAEHFLAQRGGRELTPSLNALAEDAVVFSDNTSVASMTSPGIAGILTGLMPIHSGVLLNHHMLPASAPSLPQTLHEVGFLTAAFLANPVLEPGMGFERGFDTYELLPIEKPARKARAESVTARALAWIKDRDPGSDRVFLWLHFLEPHGPYEPPMDAALIFPADTFGAEQRPAPLLAEGIQTGRNGIPEYQWNSDLVSRETDARIYLGRYAAEVWSFDRALGEFLSELNDLGWLGETGQSLIVVASDHGEALENDHGHYFSHAHPPTQDQVQTPLMFIYPGASGVRFDVPVSNLDIAPTVASLLGIDGAALHDGSNLHASIEPKPIVAQYHRYRMIRSGPYKWVQNAKGTQLIRNLKTDPGELRKAKLPPGRRAILKAEFERHAEIRPIEPSVSRFKSVGDEKAQLEALGYVE